MEKIKVFYLDVENAKEPEIVDIRNDNNDDLHRLLKCDTINVTYRSFGGKKYCVVADDVGALKKNPKLSVYAYDGYQRIYGNVIVACSKGEDLASLEHIDIVRLKTCMARYVTDKSYPVLRTDRG